MTADLLSSLAGAALSLTFSYAPGTTDWFNRLDGTRKRLVMLVLLLLTSLAVFGLACVGWLSGFGLQATCDQAGAMGLARAFLLALVANQSTYLIAPVKNGHKPVEGGKV